MKMAIKTKASTARDSPAGRGITLFDISAIPGGDIVSATSLFVYGYGKLDEHSWVTDDSRCVVVSSNPASNTDLVNADYGCLGITVYGEIAYADFTVEASNEIALSQACIDDLIQDKDIAKLGTRAGADLDDGNPAHTGSADEYNKVEIYNAEEAGTDKDEYLSITHAPPAAVLNRIMEVV